MKRFSNAGDKIQTLAVILAVLGTLMIVFVYVNGIRKYDELYLSSDSYSYQNLSVEEVNESKTLKTIVNLFIDKDSDPEHIIRVSMIILMIRSMLRFWFFMLMLFAFGELCENVYDLNHSSRVTFYNEYERYKGNQNSNLENALTNNPALDTQKIWICPSCGRQNQFSSTACVNCGHQK